MEDEVEPLGWIKTMDCHHQAIHVLIVDVQQKDARFGEEARVVSYNVTIRLLEKIVEVLSSNSLESGFAAVEFDLFEDLVPVRQAFFCCRQSYFRTIGRASCRVRLLS